MICRRRLAVWSATAFVAGSTWLACSSTPSEATIDDGTSGVTTGGTGGTGGAISPISKIRKIDLLFVIDNSASMADKQKVLWFTVPDLVNSLVNPLCLDHNGAPTGLQPSGPLEPCPVAGTTRELAPVLDLHIGVVSSSIGGHGSTTCPDEEATACAPALNYSNNDKGHLITRVGECGGGDVATWQNKSFLAWDPKQQLSPPGEGDLNNLTDSLRNIVIGTGQIGCGYESQLEGWYRFLIDPDPYQTITVIDGSATPQGIDDVLLKQRADFLRPDSLLAILMLTDENDCSIIESGQYFLAAQLKNNGTAYHLPLPRAECASNPNDPCCKSCAQSDGECPPDPTCFEADGSFKLLTDLEDPSNLRCFDQKRRFGIDFLYPIDRYTTALTSSMIPNRAGEIVPNPIFTDLNPQDDVSTVRDKSLVFLAGIVGVPWQDIARDKDNIKAGLKSPDELNAKNADGLSTWDIILGDPATYTPPADPLMIESILPRTGKNPITGDAVKQPGDPTNPINGSEWTITAQDDIQFACIFPLPQPKDCSDPSIKSCDCKDGNNDNPLCEANPMDPSQRTYQTKAKAYPGLRELALLRSLGEQGITASVCPAQLTVLNQTDYGYRPAVRALIERIKSRLPSE